MSYFVKFTLSLSLGLLLCGPLPANAGPVTDYLTEAARYTWREQESTGNGGAGIYLPSKTVSKLLKGAERIQQKDVPAILGAYFTNTKYPNQNFWRLREADGAQVLFAQPATHTTFKAPSYLCLAGRGTHGIAVGYGLDDHTALVTLPKNTSGLWADLEDETINALKVTREQLRGRKTSVSPNTLTHILETDDKKSTYNTVRTLLKNKQRVRRIDATQVPSFLQNYLNPYPAHPLYAVNPPEYFVYREADTKYYFSLSRGDKPNHHLRRFISDAYDHVKLWHWGYCQSERLRIAAMPRGNGSSLGKRLSTRTLVALGITREEFGDSHAKASTKPAPKKTTQAPRAPAKTPAKGAARAR